MKQPSPTFTAKASDQYAWLLMGLMPTSAAKCAGFASKHAAVQPWLDMHPDMLVVRQVWAVLWYEMFRMATSLDCEQCNGIQHGATARRAEVILWVPYIRLLSQ